MSGTYKSIVVSWLGENSDDPEIRLRCDLLKRSCPKFIPLINLKAMLFLTCSDLNVNKMECSWWSCEENKKVLGEVADKLKLYEVNKYTLPWNTPSELGGVFYLTKYCRVSAMLFRYLNYFKESIKWNWF